MRSRDDLNEGDLDLAALRRTPARTTPARPGFRRSLIGGLVGVVLVSFGAVVWFAYQELMPGGDAAPPLIRAEAGPLKRPPDERGGLPVVNAESAVVRALDEPDAPVRVERIVPREESVPRSTADVIPEVLEAEPAAGDDAQRALAGSNDADGATPADSLDSLLATIAESEQVAANVADEGEAARRIEPAAGPDEPAAAETPRRIVFDASPPADEAVDDTASPAAEPGDATAEVAAEPSGPIDQPATPAAEAPRDVAALGDVPIRPAVRPAAGTAATTAEDDFAAAPANEGATPPATPATPTPAITEAYRVQLLAVREATAASGAWSTMQQRHPSVLGGLESHVQRADLGGDTFYRLQAGPFANRAGAAAACTALQAEGSDCFVVEPSS